MATPILRRVLLVCLLPSVLSAATLQLEGRVEYLLGRSQRRVGEGVVSLVLDNFEKGPEGTGRFQEESERSRTQIRRRPCPDLVLGRQQVLRETRIRPFSARSPIHWKRLSPSEVLLQGVPLQIKRSREDLVLRLEPGSAKVEHLVPNSRWLPPGTFMGSCNRWSSQGTFRGNLPLTVTWTLVAGVPAAKIPLASKQLGMTPTSVVEIAQPSPEVRGMRPQQDGSGFSQSQEETAP